MKGVIIRSVTTLCFASIFLMGFTQPLPRPKDRIEFHVMGKFDDGPAFQLKTGYASSDEFVVSIKDADENVLYTETLKGNVARRYKIAIDTEDLYESFFISFEITNMKTNEKAVYNVTQKSFVVNDLVVARL